MLSLTLDENGGSLRADYRAAFSRVRIYLDNWALMSLGEDELLRERFLGALRANGTLLFSYTNAIEIGGPTGPSANSLRQFLGQIANYWLPAEMNMERIIEKEERGAGRAAPICHDLAGLVLRRTAAAQAGPVIAGNAATLFNLAGALEAATAYANDPAQGATSDKRLLAEGFRNVIQIIRRSAARPAALPNTPAAATQIALLRVFASDHRRGFEDNDAFDFLHTVLAASYAHIAALDRRWTSLVNALPAAMSRPETFYARDLAQMVARFESLTSA